MHILIDGYNVLKQVLHEGEISEKQRKAFVALMGKYGLKRNHTITIIFDGGKIGMPLHEKDHGVHVIYSGSNRSADDVISDLMRARSHGVLLVSSDNALRSQAAQRGFVSVAALEFYALVKQTLSPAPTKKASQVVYKTTTEQNSLVDELMMRSDDYMQKPDNEEGGSREARGRTLSKKERHYIQKIKKL